MNMAAGQSLIFYIGLLLIGLVLILLVWSLSRLVPKLRPPRHFRQPLLRVPDQPPTLHEAVLLIETGGRIREINTLVREWFNLAEDEFPNMERLARHVRPSEEFLKICAEEGDARFSINGRLTEGHILQNPRRRPVHSGHTAAHRNIDRVCRREPGCLRLRPANRL